VWHHDLQTPGSKAFVAKFLAKHGKPPENHAWIEYVSLKMMAQAMNEAKSTDTDKLIAYFESEAQFDLLKARKGYFRSWDHQLMQEAYPFTVKPKGRPRTSGTSCSSATRCRRRISRWNSWLRRRPRTLA
jgi:branched-chain amino acid transport system substrate-binding protein